MVELSWNLELPTSKLEPSPAAQHVPYSEAYKKKQAELVADHVKLHSNQCFCFCDAMLGHTYNKFRTP